MVRKLIMLIFIMILSTNGLSSALTHEEAIDRAYKKGFETGRMLGRQEKCAVCPRTRGMPINTTGVIGATTSGKIVLGGTKGDQQAPSLPGTRGYEFSRWMLYSQNSPLITDAVRKAINDGNTIQISGFAFNNDEIIPGQGTLSFGSAPDGSARFSSVFKNDSRPWEATKKPVPDDAKVNVQALKGLGISNGVIIEQLIVK